MTQRHLDVIATAAAALGTCPLGQWLDLLAPAGLFPHGEGEPWLRVQCNGATTSLFTQDPSPPSTMKPLFAGLLQGAMRASPRPESAIDAACMARLIEGFFDALIITDNGRILDIRGRYSELLGLHRDDLIGVSIFERTPQASHAKIRASIESGETTVFESIVTHRDGALVPVLVVGTPYERLGPQARVGVIQDLRPVRRAESELERLQGELREDERLRSLALLAGAVAHDFNNLLVGISGNAEMLSEDDDFSFEERVEMTREILQAVERAGALTTKMLSYADRAHIGPRTAVDLHPMIARAAERWRSDLAPGTTLSLDLGATEHTVLGAARTLGQVFDDLVANACDAMTTGDSTHITTANHPTWEPSWGSEPPLVRAQRWLRIDVRDTGEGIAPEVQSRVFEPFFSTKERHRGLGLSACRSLIHRHGGMLVLESTLSVGTLARVLLPLPCHKSDSQRISRRVLIADDDPSVRNLLRVALERHSLRVDDVSDGQSALDQTRTHDYALVILDLGMPSLDGHRVVQALRDAGDTTPVVLTSGYSQPDLERRIDPSLYDAFLRKPYRLSTVDQIIGDVLGQLEVEHDGAS